MAIPAIIARAANSKAVEGTLNTFGMRSVPLLAGIFDAAKKSGSGKLSPKANGESSPSRIAAAVKSLGTLAKNRVQSTAMSGLAGVSRDMSSRLNAMAKSQTGASRSLLKFGAAVTRMGSMQASRKARELRSPTKKDASQAPQKDAPKKSNKDKAEDDEKANRERQEKAAKAGQGDGELDVLKVISRDTKDIKEGIETLVKDGLKAKEEKKEEGGGLLGAIGSLLTTVVGRRLGLIAAGIAGTVGRFLSRGVASLGRLGAGLLKRPLAAASRGIASIAGRAGTVGRGLLARGGMMAAGGAIVSKASTIGRAALTKGAAAANAVRGTAGRLIGKFSPNSVDDVAKPVAAKPKSGTPQYSRGPQRGKAARAAKARAAVRRAAARKAATTAGASVAGKAAAKGVGKAVGKSVLKKIPIIGAGVGLGLAAQRAWAGDWTGAGMEAASGLAGTVPGIGTAASVGIDGALMARDMQRESALAANKPDFSDVRGGSQTKQSAVPPALKPVVSNTTHSMTSTTERHLESIDRTLKDMLDHMTSKLKGIYTKPIETADLFEQQKQHVQSQNANHTQQQSRQSYGEGRPAVEQPYYDPRGDYTRTGQPSLNARDPSKPDFSDVWGSVRTTEGFIQKYEPKSSLNPLPVGAVGEGVGVGLRGKAAESEKILAAQAQEMGITDPRELRAFLAQTRHESGNYRYSEEIWGKNGGTAAQQRYEGRRDLGNTQQGDGKRFRGRGFIQLTGRANYEAFARDTGIDVVNNPDLLSKDPQLSAKAAVWFWKKNVRRRAKGDWDNVERVTRAVNGGLNGIEDRRRNFAMLGRGNLTAPASSPSTVTGVASIPPALRASQPSETTATIARASAVATAQKKAAPVVVMNPPAPPAGGAHVSRNGGGGVTVPPVIVRSFDAPIKNYSNMLVSII